MRNEIRVHVVDYGRKSLYMRFKDPVTGKQVARSTGTANRREAAKVAAKWEHDLQQGRFKPASKIGWAEFRARYEDDELSGLADSTAVKASGVFNAVESILNPARLADVTAERLSHFKRTLREQGRAETTIKGHLAHLQAAMNWAKRVGMLHDVPKFDMPRRVKGSKMMKGRPVTGEEFERMLSKVPEVVPPHAVESWRHLLRGLWWSGLRRGEAMKLSWDRDGLSVEMSGKYPMLRIPAEAEKGHKDRLLPIAPEFCEMLMATPDVERTGWVFEPVPTRKKSSRLSADAVGRTISAIGQAASVKVDTDSKGKIKYASAHDLRRSFGERWAARVMPPVLMQLMRHEKIETTLKFYVGRNAEVTSEVLWQAVSGNTSGNTRQSGEVSALVQSAANC